jgi:RNA polymerase sigma-70 factor, ECF subfamily
MGPTVSPVDHDDEVPDDVLVTRILGGAKTLFAVLMRRHNQKMFRAVRAIVRQDAETEDVVQQAWLSAYRALGTFRGEASLRTWLTRIAVNEAYGHMRAKQRRGEHFPLEAGEDMASSDRTPEEAAVARETVAWLEAHIDALPEPSRVVFVLRDVEELDTAETAAVLGISEGTVRVRLHRARHLLQDVLADTVHGAFSFDGERCDRIVRAVMERI